MHRRSMLTAILAVMTVGLAGLRLSAQEPDLSKAPRITLAEFKKLYDAHDVVVVDVRDEGAFKTGHIPGALSIPVDRVESKADHLKTLNKTIVTYCA